MYVFVRGSAEQKGLPGVWQDTDLSNLTFNEINQRYSNAVAIIKLVETKQNYTLDFANLPFDLKTLDLVFNDWLALIGNRTIEFLEVGEKEKKVVTATFTEAYSYGFKVLGYNRDFHEDRQLTDQQVIDLRLVKSDVDYQELKDNCLFSVNGIFYNVLAAKNGIIIPDAARSRSLAKDNRVGLVNFGKLGKLTCYPITEDNIVKTYANVPMSDTVYLNIPNVDLTNKTMFLVIGGVLHTMDGWYSQVGTNLLKLNFKSYPWVEHYWDFKQRYQLPEFNIQRWENRVDKLKLDELFSNDTITKLLTCPQSFIVTIDGTGIQVLNEPIHNACLAGRHYTYGSKPNLPIFNDQGFICEYTSYRGHDDTYVIRAPNDIRDHRLYDYTEWRSQTFITDHQVTTSPFRYSELFFKRIVKSVDE